MTTLAAALDDLADRLARYDRESGPLLVDWMLLKLLVREALPLLRKVAEALRALGLHPGVCPKHGCALTALPIDAAPYCAVCERVRAENAEREVAWLRESTPADLAAMLRSELSWIADQYDDERTTGELANRCYDMACTARMLLGKLENQS